MHKDSRANFRVFWEKFPHTLLSAEKQVVESSRVIPTPPLVSTKTRPRSGRKIFQLYKRFFIVGTNFFCAKSYFWHKNFSRIKCFFIVGTKFFRAKSFDFWHKIFSSWKKFWILAQIYSVPIFFCFTTKKSKSPMTLSSEIKIDFLEIWIYWRFS